MPKAFPKWVAEEISEAKMEYDKKISISGYLLDINEKDMKVDVQFYDNLPDGRHIATLDLNKNFKSGDLKFGESYEFNLKIFKSAISKKLIDFLTKNYSITMDAVYSFELESAKLSDKS